MTAAAIRQDGNITAMAALRQPAQADTVAEDVRLPRRGGGRPPGSLSSPLARWLRDEIKQAKRDRWTCRDAFEMLVENNRRAIGDAFVVGAETASEVINVVRGDIKGRRVGFEYFRKLWRDA